ncbi:MULTISPECIES: FAD-dependent oxidoreductase [Rhizobium]|uniref:2-polyprenyl-6-methoxyphenol hydroxylase-like FAD-dependent oxidoreductase n=1 Tax=Rhizobium tropici TaxID=398 RepID=A0A6P1C6Z7_RHITR|nr:MULTISPECIES: NAD(P)/FAD-dependent oxidoreductase [Rhizobium]AGB74714.1 monooxygenase, FAD-binding protein [Rhizobium tropici CIAT 899]MBB4242262.1 2-polyprenyl-6-methoxyphenol hydroxylase-like FAD-dependent oxidoreductase [Rhizobium tropici]MBB5593713.1 2-polyprenyl-6-methoxyphenol hydroxylase-like FAD-dependent oxidoreductase [Rhizobium tropici]MBB6492587.1 2-polyprenyl-6-methoxyphenol hydroxylase-like FAD-dependent oxidoreductase [Rhizobium tropici]NEV12176.1 FAD-dependent monooxygenase 
MQDFHVVIIGAGLGGLCLAQGLKRAGIRFDVYERDPAADSRLQGYRIRIDANGQQALASCLPTALFDLFRATASTSPRSACFLTPQLLPVTGRTPASWDTGENDDDGDLSVNRLTLREILLSGIEDHVHLGHAFTHYRCMDHGRVEVQFDGAAPVSCNLLVGADGVNSQVRRQLAPYAEPADTGSICVYGKSEMPLNDAADLLGNGTTVVFADGCTAIFDLMRFRNDLPNLAAILAPDCKLTSVTDYLYWALIGPRQRLGLETYDHTQDLPVLLRTVMRGWHPELKQIVSRSRATAVAALSVRSGRPDALWPFGPVTLLGDAIHAMSPAGGLGANTALEDARMLAQILAEAGRETKTTCTALLDYEADMRERATCAIDTSERGAAMLFAAITDKIA